MKLLPALLLIAICVTSAGAKDAVKNNSSPLAEFSAEWNDPKYKVCNTAVKTKYLSPKEKEIIYVLNLARMNPSLFCKTVISKAYSLMGYVDTTSPVYYRSLVKLLWQMQPANLLTPDSMCFVSAQCHALSTGLTGAATHDRQTEECKNKQRYRGECCTYGISSPVAIVVTLLIDEDVESLGHRNICLGPYKMMSPAFRPHKTYGSTTVLDFR